jgi:predicted RNA-binding protein YlxR (DUF448 family)
MKVKKPPLRTCLGCGREADKRELMRFVRTSDGDVHVDPSGKLNGRGGYVCTNSQCFEAAVRKKRFAAALHANLREEDIERLRREFEQTLTD